MKGRKNTGIIQICIERRNSFIVKQIKNSTGITLIALIITIVVLLILAGVSISIVTGDNGILSQAQGSSTKTKLATYLEELDRSIFGESEVIDGKGYVQANICCFGNDLKNYIPSIEDGFINDFVIVNNELMYVGTNEEVKEIAESLGIESGENGRNIVNVSNWVKTVTGVQPLDNEPTPANFKGKRLYTKNNENSTKWDIVIDYTATNTVKARYGSGWYLIEKVTKIDNGDGTITEEPTIIDNNGETIEIKNDYVVNYSTGEMKLLSNYKEWNLGSQLAVTDNIALHVDATNLANGEWRTDAENTEFDKFYVNNIYQNVKRHGDVVYDTTSRALLFNENTTSNPDGEGGYLEYKKTGLNLENGFTFEMYMNLSRLKYNNGSGATCGSLFCKIPSLSYSYTKSMRFGLFRYENRDTICKFYTNTSWIGEGLNARTISEGDVQVEKEQYGYTINEDAYVTYVYRRYEKTTVNKEDFNWNENADRLEYYINGELYGYTYYGKDSYKSGCDIWNGDECPLFVGVSPWFGNNSLYYLKGKVYGCRLYETDLSPENVKKNYDATVQFRNSGL